MTDSNAMPAAPAPTGERSSVLHAGRQIRHGPLLPWMCAYAEWLCLECIEPPSTASKLANARRFARLPVTARLLVILEGREDFGAYVTELNKGPLEAARAKFLNAFPTYIERHREALDRATEAGDYTAMARITEPVLDRVMPKKVEGGNVASVTVVLAAEQMKAIAVYEAPAMSVEAEVISVEPA